MKARCIVGAVVTVLVCIPVQRSARAEDQAEKRARVQERMRCSMAAAEHWGLPRSVVLAVAEIEGGRPGQWVKNRNGTADVGPMQFNTRYLQQLTKAYGITAAHVAVPGCYPYELAAWRLRRHLVQDAGDFWSRLSNYHSRTPALNDKYRRKLMRRAQHWAQWLVATHGQQDVSLVEAALALGTLRGAAVELPPLPVGATGDQQAPQTPEKRRDRGKYSSALSAVTAQIEARERALRATLRAVWSEQAAGL